jgi:hypothetical protein
MSAAPAKVSLFDMADFVGRVADRHRQSAKENPAVPALQEAARIWSTAQLTLSLMALDEDASRKFVTGLIKAHGFDAKLLIGMLTYVAPKVDAEPAQEVEAA